MDFLLWVCRCLLVFGIVVWLGGLMFQSAALGPVVNAEGKDVQLAVRKAVKRFTGMMWMSMWTVFITGTLMMLFNPRFLWFQYKDTWSTMLLVKQGIFVLMVFYGLGFARMLRYLESPSSNGGYDEKVQLYKHRLQQFRTISVALGIAGLLAAAGMTYGG